MAADTENKEHITDGTELMNLDAGEDSKEGSPSSSEVSATSPTSLPQKEVFKVAGKEFETKEEMTDFVNQLQSQKAAAEAYAQGLKEAQPTGEAVPKVDPMKELEEEFFNDPAAALAKAKEQAKQEAIDHVTSELAWKQEQTDAINSFYKNNPDLAGKQELMNALISKYAPDPAFKDLPLQEGLNKVGSILRKQLGMEKSLPTGGAVTAGVTHVPSSDTVTEPNKEEPVDFIKQVRQYQKRD